jgi:GNAT superfamily N-acetyltransferase
VPWPRLVCLPGVEGVLEWEVRASGSLGYLRAVDGAALWISHIGVEPAARGQGWASRLVQVALQHSGGRVVTLTAAPFPSWREPGLDHAQLQAWYTRHGFHLAPSRADPYRMVRAAVCSQFGAS